MKRFEKSGSQQILFDIVRFTLASSKAQVIATDVRLGIGGEEVAISPDGMKLIYRTQNAEQTQFHLVNLDSGVEREIEGPPLEVHGLSRGPLWSQTSDGIYYVKHGVLWRSDTDLAREQIVGEIPGYTITALISGYWPSALWIGDKKTFTVVMAQEKTTEQDAFYAIDLSDGKSRKLLQTGECYTCALEDDQVTTSSDGSGR